MADAIQTRSKNILILSLNFRSFCDKSQSLVYSALFFYWALTTSFCFKISDLKTKGLRSLYQYVSQ